MKHRGNHGWRCQKHIPHMMKGNFAVRILFVCMCPIRQFSDVSEALVCVRPMGSLLQAPLVFAKQDMGGRPTLDSTVPLSHLFVWLVRAAVWTACLDVKYSLIQFLGVLSLSSQSDEGYAAKGKTRSFQS